MVNSDSEKLESNQPNISSCILLVLLWKEAGRSHSKCSCLEESQEMVGLVNSAVYGIAELT